MPKPNNSGEFANIHKRQLFHWIGADIDASLRARELSAEAARQKYLEYLKDDLQNGLPVKRPRVPEKLACGHVEVELDLPMACFTEWALSESRPHSSRYGRMALGFSKPWVIQRGGQPVSYFSHVQKGLFLKQILALYEFLQTLRTLEPCPPGLKASEIHAAWEQARYLLHFAKPFAPPKVKPEHKRRRPAAVPRPVAAKRPVPPRPAMRYYGPVLEFLEEREWRIVRHDQRYFAADPTGHFDSRLGFKLGTELFTLLLPDNELVKMVWKDATLRRLFLKAKVPVTVLSFQDIGTF